MSFPVFDLHCDTASALCRRDLSGYMSLRRNNLHIDLERAKQLDGYAQCFACFTSTLKEAAYGVSAAASFELQLQTIQNELQRNADMIRIAKTGDQIRKNMEDGFMSAVLSIEGPAGFGFNPDRLEALYEIGFRISTLGWNESNVLTGSHLTGEGLTDIGKHYVTQAQELGMLIDVSHISDRGFWDIMEITDSPVIASHSNSRSVYNVSRNVTDDMFRAICQSGGVVGINQYSDFLGEKPTLDTVCDHVVHFLELDPEGKHIALGADLDGCDELPEGFAGIQDYPALAKALLKRGLDNRLIRNIYWNNAMGVMKRCCM